MSGIPDNNPKRQTEAEIRRENAFADAGGLLYDLEGIVGRMGFDDADVIEQIMRVRKALEKAE